MSKKSAKSLAKEILAGEPGGLEELRIHEFTDDESAHDDEQLEKLHADFSAELERAQKELTKIYGEPARTGEADDEIIPLGGVFRFAVWEVGEVQLFIAASHEDRGVPILLKYGSVPSNVVFLRLSFILHFLIRRWCQFRFPCRSFLCLSGRNSRLPKPNLRRFPDSVSACS
jgi:hypothetical protein